MISLFVFGRAVLAAIDKQVQEFVDLCVYFVELIVMSLFW
jgi:hypothetical protein